MSKNYAGLHDPNAEYMMRELSAETTGVTTKRGGGRDVEITDAQTTMVGGNFPWMLVRIYTDAGVVDTGEVYWGAGVPELIERMKSSVIGENPLDIDRLYEHLVQKMPGKGSVEGATVTAISGIKVALHGPTDKILDIPAYQLLGGKCRGKVRVYCDCHTEKEADPEACADKAERVIDELGYDALKFDLDVPSSHEKDRANRHLRPGEIRHKAEIVEKVTGCVKDRTDVAFDYRWTLSGGSVKYLTAELGDYDVWWLKDPVPPENLDVQGEVTKSTFTPITVGENRCRVTELRRFVENQAVDIVAPDMPKVGGMRETQKITDVANQYYVPVAMHNVSSPVTTIASAHAGMAIPNSLAVGYHSYELGWWEDLVGGTVIEDGYIGIPGKPSLGMTLDMDIVEEHMVDGETPFDEV